MYTFDGDNYGVDVGV